ncbi:MAG TPA: ABC transporter permease [Thermoanaerobaculia bacterium]
MAILLQDLRYALRTLAKSPGFTAVAIATLALGIGANTAIFSLVDRVLLRPLPYPDPEMLATMPRNVSLPDLLDLKASTHAFEAMGGIVPQPLDLTGGGQPLQVSAGLVAEDFFEALGARAALGRPLTRRDDQYGGERVVAVRHGFWVREWGADPSLVGRTITLGGLPYTVVGVLREDFATPQDSADVFVPLRVAYPVAARERGVHFLRTVFRMRSGVTLAAARAELDAACRRLAALHPEENAGTSSELMPLLDRVVGSSRLPLAILSAAVALVLLIACANLANLLLARAASRRGEMAIRTALGAGRGRLVRQVLTESLLLSLAGGAAGLFLAGWGTELMLQRLPETLPRLDGVGIDLRVASFTGIVSLATGLVFGLLPAWRASRTGFAEALASSRGVAGPEPRRLRGMLVIAEIALALMLLVGAGLLVNALWRLQAVPPGFDPVGVVTARIDLPESRYEEALAQTAFRRQVLEHLNSVAGVQAAMISEIPLGGNSLHHNFLIEGGVPIPPGEEPSLYSRSVMGDYFRTMRIALRAGRDFMAQDREGAPLVGILNESMVREYFRGRDPIGARIRWAREEGVPRWIEIVGVAADVNHFGLGEGEQPAVYTPYAQSRQAWKRWMDLVVRAPRGTPGLVALVRQKVWAVDPLIPVPKARSMEEVVATSLARTRFQARLLTAFGAAALLLSSIGIYGVMAGSVRRRTTEIGVRMALGAAPSRVIAEVLSEGLRLTAAGVGLGLLAALASSRALSSLLFGVRSTDPATYAVVAVLLSAVALLACYFPARRAASVDPMAALRME